MRSLQINKKRNTKLKWIAKRCKITKEENLQLKAPQAELEFCK